MADYKTTVALEIGAQSVTMGVFTPAGRGFALSRYARRDIVLDPVEEGMRMDYVSNAIGEMVTELKLRGSDVRNVVSGQQVFMRFLKLPALDSDNLAEQVGFEAQQHIPFPLEDIVYDYQELPDRGEGEREVLLVAIKKDVLDELNTQVEGNSLRTRSVDCATTSLYNAFRISYPEETEPVMLLDIGAKTTDIIFSEEGRFFTRSVTAAGSFITNSIAREYNMSFRDAETFKLNSGSVSLGNGHTDSMGEQEAELATTIRSAMGRLSSEVQRTINHYRAQYKGSHPVKAYICGGGARLPYALEFLQSALNIPVEYFNPLQAFSIGSKVDQEALESDAICLGPIVGAAVTGAHAGAFDIDLVPTSVGKDRAEKALLPKVIAAGVTALVGAGVFAASAYHMASKAEIALKKATPADAEVAQLNDQIAAVQSKFQKTMQDIDSVAAIYRLRFAYADIIRQLSSEGVSVKFWFTEFAPLINYDVEGSSLVGSTDVKGTRLISWERSKAGQDSAVNQAPEEVDTKKRNKDPMVTAVYVSGYTIRPAKDAANDPQRQTIYDWVGLNFDERHADSLFAFDSGKMQKDLNHYFQFIAPKDAKGKQPEYVDKFMVVMPLKTPIAIPELSNGKK